MPPTQSLHPDTSDARPFRLAGPGHVVFALTLIALGLMGLIKGGFVPTWSGVPKALPGRTTLAYLCAGVSLASGIGLLWSRTAAIASRALLACFGLWMLFFRVPLLYRMPTAPGAWWACGEIAVMIAAAWVLVVRFAGDADGTDRGLVTGATGLHVARVLYAFGIAMFGIAHFTFVERTVSMVPGWMPWHLATGYLTGAALVAAGIAIAVRVLGRLAATLSAWELGLFTLFVWGPVVLAHPSAEQWIEVIDSWVLTAAAWVVAESWRGKPWLSVGSRSSR